MTEPATPEQVGETFSRIPYRNKCDHNWGCAYDKADAKLWEVSDETYINGIMAVFDFDFHIGYLLEIVDRNRRTIRYMVVMTFYGPNPDTGAQAHRVREYPHECGTFFERTEAAKWPTVTKWAVDEAYEMLRGENV